MDDHELLAALLPASWMAWLHEWTPTILALTIALTAFVHVALPIARRLEAAAKKSTAKWDDGPARALVQVLVWWVTASKFLLTWMPRMTVGPGTAVPPAEKPKRRTRSITPTTLAMITLAVLEVGTVVLAPGCGGPPREARMALETTAGGVELADRGLTVAVQHHGEEARVQVRRETREGVIRTTTVPPLTVAGVDLDTVVAHGLVRFEELMQPTTAARTVLDTTSSALRSAEGALDAWAAGTDDGGDFFSTVACAVVSVAQLVSALEVAGVDIPEQLTDGVRLVSVFATGACPGGH